MKAIEDEICNRRDSNPLPLPPSYHAPSFITPSLKYLVARDGMVPRPPPPPPRAGEAAAGFGEGAGARQRGNGPRGIRHGGRTAQQNHVNTTLDESYFSEGLFDPAAPVQAVTTTDVDGWGASHDPWGNVSSGADWLAESRDGAGRCTSASSRILQANPVAPVPQAAAVVPPLTAAPLVTTGKVAGQMLLQSLQQHRPVATTAVVSNGLHVTAPPAVSASPAATAPQLPVAPPSPAAALVTVPTTSQPTGNPILPHNLAVNPTLAAARAVAHAAMQAQQHMKDQQQQQPLTVQQPQSQAFLPAFQMQSAGLSPSVYQGHPQPQQQPRPYAPIVGTFPAATFSVPALAPAGPAMAIPYMPPTQAAATNPAPRPHISLPYPMALFNPAMAVLNNTAGIAAFAPRAAAMGATARPVAVPIIKVHAAAQAPPPPSATLTTSAAGVAPVAGLTTSASASAAAAAAAAVAAAAAAVRRTAVAVQSRLPPPTAAHESLPPPPAAAHGPRPSPPAAALVSTSVSAPPPNSGFPSASWQCLICTYDHKGSKANFLACAICGCERGMQQLPP